MEQVVWKPILGYPYQASTLGEVQRIGGKILKPQRRGNNGYLSVDLCKDGKIKPCRVSRIIASVFHGMNLHDLKQLACHKDDNIMNNREDNIFVGTFKDNTQDMMSKGREGGIKNKGDNNGMAKFTDEVFIRAIEMYNNNVCIKDIAKILLPSYSSIQAVIYGQRRKHLFHLVSKH